MNNWNWQRITIHQLLHPTKYCWKHISYKGKNKDCLWCDLKRENPTAIKKSVNPIKKI